MFLLVVLELVLPSLSKCLSFPLHLCRTSATSKLTPRLSLTSSPSFLIHLLTSFLGLQEEGAADLPFGVSDTCGLHLCRASLLLKALRDPFFSCSCIWCSVPTVLALPGLRCMTPTSASLDLVRHTRLSDHDIRKDAISRSGHTPRVQTDADFRKPSEKLGWVSQSHPVVNTDPAAPTADLLLILFPPLGVFGAQCPQSGTSTHLLRLSLGS